MKQTTEEATKPGFDEKTLRLEIIKIWGEHGAHIEVYDKIAKHALSQQSPLIGIEELKKSALEIIELNQKSGASITECFSKVLDLLLPHLRTSNTQSEAVNPVEFLRWIYANCTHLSTEEEQVRWHHIKTNKFLTENQLYEIFIKDKGIKQD